MLSTVGEVNTFLHMDTPTLVGSDGNEGILRIPQSSSIIGTSPSDCLVSCQGLSLGESYSSAEEQLVCSIAPANWAVLVRVQSWCLENLEYIYITFRSTRTQSGCTCYSHLYWPNRNIWSLCVFVTICVQTKLQYLRELLELNINSRNHLTLCEQISSVRLKIMLQTIIFQIIYIYIYIYLPTPSLGQDMKQGQFLSGV